MRPTKDQYYLTIAEAVAIRSTCVKHKYGVVIANRDEIMATGYNGSPRGEVNCCDLGYCYRANHETPISSTARIHGDQYGTCIAVHAEQNALLCARRKDIIGATLYLATLTPGRIAAPCNMCERLIKNAGIARIITQRGGTAHVDLLE